MGIEAPFHPRIWDPGLTWGPTVIPRKLLGSNFIGHPKNRGVQFRSPRQGPKNYFWAGCKSNDLEQAEPSLHSHEDWPPTKTALQLCSAPGHSTKPIPEWSLPQLSQGSMLRSQLWAPGIQFPSLFFSHITSFSSALSLSSYTKSLVWFPFMIVWMTIQEELQISIK